MKTLTTAAALAAGVLLTAATPSGAQTIGAKGGLNLSTLAVSPAGELGEIAAKPGVTAGAFMTFKEASKLSFEVAGLISMRRISFGPVITDTITYVEAPVLARYRVMTRSRLLVRAVGGVVPAFRIVATEAVAGDSFSVKDAYKAIDLAVAVGAEVEWKKKWFVDARYLIGASPVYEVTLGSERTRQRGIQVLIGYRLR